MGDPKRIERKTFLNYLLGGGIVSWLAVIIWPLIRFIVPPKRASAAADWIEVAKITEIGPGKGKDVTSAQDKPVMIINRGTSTQSDFVALSKICTHLACIVELRGKEIPCPCHAGIFDLDGINISGPPPMPLAKYDLKIQGETIYLGPVIRTSNVA